MRQVLYTLDNIEKMYLCAYANAYVSKGTLVLVNTLTNTELAVSGEEERIRKIWNDLLTGVEENRLIAELAEIGCESAYELWIREGMIE